MDRNLSITTDKRDLFTVGYVLKDKRDSSNLSCLYFILYGAGREKWSASPEQKNSKLRVVFSLWTIYEGITTSVNEFFLRKATVLFICISFIRCYRHWTRVPCGKEILSFCTNSMIATYIFYYCYHWFWLFVKFFFIYFKFKKRDKFESRLTK